MSTGYKETNIWLEWLAEAAKQASLAECVACAAARPTLFTEPVPLFPEDVWGFSCMLNLTIKKQNTGCSTLSTLFPLVGNNTKAGPFTATKRSDYHSFNFTTPTPKVNVGQITQTWCNVTTSAPTAQNKRTIIGPLVRAGLFYYCGENRLLTRILDNTIGLCAMVRLAAPLTLIGPKIEQINVSSTRRSKRSTNFDPTVGSPTYIDSIGVPRGVPNKFKLVDQIAAGFENIPLIAAVFPVTPNKNVDRNNYIHYNVMRLSNLTRDAMEGLAEQLAPTSLMAVQNRMALDMLLAEKGGVCSMFGDLCCSFIPNNTAPDGKVTRALEGLKTLSNEMKSHSGIDNPLEDWFHKTFGQWKGVIMSILVSIAVFIAILVTCGCCCIPCIRSLSIRLISSALEKQDPAVVRQMLQLDTWGHRDDIENFQLITSN